MDLPVSICWANLFLALPHFLMDLLLPQLQVRPMTARAWASKAFEGFLDFEGLQLDLKLRFYANANFLSYITTYYAR